ncbi:hypothetical protein Tco_1132265 [Tanacetum coccineum]|uniref:Uncharacterized protein n=1 Tax=Tanacetum coccineum TaxID=301880 RepID=A0ABQ5JFJ0_9ASTR
MSIDEELAKKVFEEEQAKAKAEQERHKFDFKTALELQRQLDEREEVAAKEAHDIDWSDPSVLRYHALQNRSFSVAEVRKNMCLYLKNQGGYKMSHFKGMSYEDIRPIFEKVWDQNEAFIPMGSEIEKEVMKRSGFDLQQESSKPIEEEVFQQDDVVAEQDVKESSRTAGGRRKKSLARKRAKETLSEESAKKQKLEDHTEKEELQVYLNIVPEEESLNIESLATKQDVLELYRLVKEDSNSKSAVIHMMVEKKYPLSQDTLSKMLSRRLEVDYQSEMSYELISRRCNTAKGSQRAEIKDSLKDEVRSINYE